MKKNSKFLLLLLSFVFIFNILGSVSYAQSLPNTSLKYMQRGSDVKEVQLALKKLGYNLNADGSYGPATKAAVLSFQKKYKNLTNDGLYGPKTRAVMLKALNGKTTNTSTTSTGKVAYLTFDDGPSTTVTPKILKTLDDYNIKATFFVLGSAAKSNPKLLKTIKAKGHSIGNHSYSHNYNYIYANMNNFWSEINKTEGVFKSVLGRNFKTRLIRFPGGSFENYKKPYKNSAIKNGYKVYDWNSLNGDSESRNVPVSKLLSRTKETVRGQKEIVFLMHDNTGKDTTAQALPAIIKYLKSQGYSFKALPE